MTAWQYFIVFICWLWVAIIIIRRGYWWSWSSTAWQPLHLLPCHQRSLLSQADTRQLAPQSGVYSMSLSAAWSHAACNAKNWLRPRQPELVRCVTNAGWDICEQWHPCYCVFSVSWWSIASLLALLLHLFVALFCICILCIFNVTHAHLAFVIPACFSLLTVYVLLDHYIMCI